MLSSQAADNYAGFAALARVRAERAIIGETTARLRVEAALASNPNGPAADALRSWLAVEAMRTGDVSRAALIAPPSDTAWLRERAEEARRDRTRRRIAAASASLASVYAITTLASVVNGVGRWRWRSARMAGLLVGGVPMVFAAVWDSSLVAGFGAMAAVVSGAVLAAGRAPAWVAAPGTLGAVAAMAWWNGWFPSLGIG